MSGVPLVRDPVDRLRVWELGGAALYPGLDRQRPVNHRGEGRGVAAVLLPPGEAGDDEFLLALAGAGAGGPVLLVEQPGIHRGRCNRQQRHLVLVVMISSDYRS